MAGATPQSTTTHTPTHMPPDTLDADTLRKMDRYWRACNYLSAGMIYLRDNPLLREPLKPEHIKNRLLGHWGSDPGQSFLLVDNAPVFPATIGVMRVTCLLNRAAPSNRHLAAPTAFPSPSFPVLKTSRFLDLLRIPGFKPLASATLMLGVAMSFTAPYLSLFGVERAGMTPFRLGVFMTLIAASGVLASTFAGRWSDASGRHRPLLLTALILAALGYLCLCVVLDYRLLLVVGIVFIGAGGSAISMVFSFSRAALPVPDPNERTFASATLRTILSAAWVFGPSVGALVLAGTGFYGLFLFAAASFGTCAFIVWRMHEPQGHLGDHTVEDTASEPSASITVPPLTAPAEDAHEDLPGVASPNDIRRAVAALTLLGLAANATMIVLPLYIVHGLNGTHLDVSVMLGLGALMEIPMMLALGARSSMLHKPNWLGACAAVHALYFIGMSVAGTVHVLIPMQILNAFVVAVTSCLGMTYVQDLMPQAPGRATALFFNAARVGSILSGVLSGLLVQAFSYRGTFLFCGLLALAALVLFSVPGYRYPLMWAAAKRFARSQYERVQTRRQ